MEGRIKKLVHTLRSRYRYAALKIAVAPKSHSPKQSFGRGEPELRVYATYLDSDNSNWDDTAHSFEGHNSDDTWAVGAMVNVWW